MIKRVIFDLDNTLIDWKDEYFDISMQNVVKELKLTYEKEELKTAFAQSVIEHEANAEKMNRKELLSLINEKLTNKVPENFIDIVLKHESEMVPEKIEEELIDTLEYLNQKYEVVILTNWFEESQIKRLEKVGMTKYFKEIYTAEYSLKPNRKSYIKAAGNCNVEECVMIGDSLEKDVYGPINCGMEAIYYNPCGKDIPDKEPKYKVVQKISELKDIL